jgi:hypothetical protein
MAAITDLFMRIAAPTNLGKLPLVVLMHGWSQAAGNYPEVDYLRIANLGLFVLVVGMRGRDSADGTIDASARELYDIYDAIQYVKNRRPYLDYIDTDKVAIVGYSGGGGNALACACKFPDLFNVVVSHFGMSDLGRNNPNGWYYNNGAGVYTASIVTRVGDTPANVPNNYYARDTTVAIQNFSDGFLYLYHDQQDESVPYVHSARIKTALDNASLSNYSYNLSNVGDTVRWLHGYPSDNPENLNTVESTWSAKIKSQAVWTIPASGTVTVIGYIVTKRFTIWLNTGLDAAATVVYNTATDTYTVTPLTTGDVTVVITQGVKTATATISAETEMVVT